MVDEILAIFRVIAPEFAGVSDPDIKAEIAVMRPLISSRKFGELYTRAVALMVAHEMTMRNFITSEGAVSTAGNVTSEREGDLEKSYGNLSDSDSFYARTAYGRQFLDLRRMCIVGVMTRFG